MKRKLFFLIIVLSFVLVGCGKKTDKDILKELTKKIENATSYYIEGNMDIINNEDTYNYQVNVSHKKEDYYKVYLKNQSNNHEQIILRNKDGVYVVTPSLNKSFKFQSEWPYNNSQVYLLKSIINDINNDENKSFEEKDGYYIFTSKVNFPNNLKLNKQLVFIDKSLNIKEIQVLDENNNLQIKMTFNKIDYKSEFKENYFELNTNLESSIKDEENFKEVTSIEDVIYPMYLPTNTYLTSRDTVATDSGERLILTFDGDSPFMLIEETVKYEDEHITIPTYGTPDMLVDTIATISDNSINWFSNGIEYYVISDVLAKNELLDIARSISVIPVSK
ncbi:MAG: hypothetical protein Q4G04_02970 [bacterium]|nr:hypothetical protein [bacterium]